MRALPTARGSVLAGALLLAACGGASPARSTATHPTATSGASAPVTGVSPAAAGSASRGDWTQFDYDAQRSGVAPGDTGITAGNLGGLSARVVRLDGTVDSSAIELHAIKVGGRSRDLIVVTTTYGRTVAIDARTGGRLWEYVPPGPRGYEGTYQVTTATPIADPDRRYVYAASPDGRIRKLVLASGHEVRSGHWPVAITFDPTKEKIASALNISGRYVIAVTGGYYGDAPPYQGHVAMIDRASGRVLHVFNTLCSNQRHLIVPSSCPDSDSAIWARAGAIVEPGSGRLLVATGNGPFNGRTAWGDSVLELSSDASRLLHNWTPSNQADLNNSDTDVGSTAPALLPLTGGRRLAVQGGKDRLMHLLDLARLDGTNGGAGPRTGGELQSIASPRDNQVYSTPAVWVGGGRTYIFAADDSGTSAYVLGGGANPRLSVAWQHATPGTSPVVAGGLLYVYDHMGGVLNIRRPSTGDVVASLPASAGHWNSPIVVGGRIVLPVGNYMDHSTHGTLYIYHLPGR